MTFDAIYRDNAWNGVESRSGPGSGSRATRYLRKLLPRLMAELQLRTVLDVGCGDGWWMPDLPGYVGTDVTDEALQLARQNHPDRTYVRIDLREHVPPAVDLIVVRDVLQHLSHASGQLLLGNLLLSGSRYLLASTYRHPGAAADAPQPDIEDGGYAEPDLLRPPYLLPPPARVYHDGWSYHGAGLRDRRKLLGLWQLR